MILSNKGADNSLSIDKTSSYLLTDKLGINKQNPEHTLDVYGDIKLSGSLIGMNNNRIIDHNADIVINPSNNFNKFIVNAPTMFKSNESNGGVVIGDTNIEPSSGSLVVENDIRDIHNNKFLEQKNDLNFNINPDGKKNTNFYGEVNFLDQSKGVRVGNTKNTPKNGELHIEKSYQLEVI